MFNTHFRRLFVLILVVGLLTAVLRMSTAVTAQQPVSPPTPDERALLPRFPSDETGATGDAILSPDVPAWSKGVFQSYRDGNWEIYSSGQSVARLTTHNASDIYPRFNRGATRIVFSSNRDGDYELFMMNANGSGLQQLTFNGAHDVNPIWSPDGSKIAFQSYRDGQSELYVMNANGTNQTRLTVHSAYDGDPTWSPDGSKIAFRSSRAGAPFIYVMNSNGTGVAQLSAQPSYYVAWSPDGSQIAYTADLDGDDFFEMWLMNADGSNQRMIFDPYEQQADAWVRGWSPDGREILFTHIKFIQYQGNWYWEWAYANYYVFSDGSIGHLDYAGREWHPDWQTMDTLPPQTKLETISTYSQIPDFQVRWSGVEQEPSAGLATFDVQYKAGPSGPWVDWQMGVTTTSAAYTAVPGTTVSFRARARDNAFNVENWSTVENQTTTFYTWSLGGKLTDNRGASISQAPLSITPLSINEARTDQAGNFFLWLKTQGSHAVDIIRSGYGDLAQTSLNIENLAHIYLPPANNTILNGGFEAAQPLANWTSGGNLPVTAVTKPHHTGSNGVLLGDDCPYPCLSDIQSLNWANYATFDMVTDSEGTLHVVWVGARINELDRTYYLNRSVDGVWSERFLLSDGSSWSAPIVTIDQFDTLHIVWHEGLNDIYYRQRSASGSWTPIEFVPSDSGFPAGVVVDREGRIHLLVTDDDKSRYLERTSQGLWQPSLQLNQYPAEGGTIALGPDDVIHFVWTETVPSPNGDYEILHQVRNSDGTWNGKEGLFVGYDYQQFSPKPHHMLVAENNSVHLFWNSLDGIDYVFRSPYGIWTEPFSLPISDGKMDVALDSQGHLHLINDSEDFEERSIFYRLWSFEAGWTAPIELSMQDVNCCATIAVDKFDTLHLLWRELDSISYQSVSSSSVSGTGQLSQTLTIPPGMEHPTLSFMLRGFRDIPEDASGLELLVSDGVTTTAVPLPNGGAAWTHYWADLSPWAGQTVTVEFRLTQISGDPRVQAAIDDVTLGSAYPDTWVRAGGPPAALPGETVVLTLEYGNNGRVPSAAAELALTWPDALNFVSASVTPTVTADTLTWDVGDLAAEAAPVTIVVTATVDAATPLWETIEMPVSLSTTTTEVEQQNNQAIISILIAHRLFLPVMARP